jgi:stage III sporulation protein AH
MTILKRNQVIVILLAIMIIAAGYLNVTNDRKSQMFSKEITGTMDEKLGSATLVEDADNNPNSSTVSDVASAVPVSGVVAPPKANTVEQYFTETRMERENARSQETALQQKIIGDQNTSKEMKDKAQTEVNAIAKKIENEMIVERLVKAKGFKDVMVFINQDVVNVIVSNEGKITKEQATQIQEIALRETKAAPQNVRIIVK